MGISDFVVLNCLHMISSLISTGHWVRHRVCSESYQHWWYHCTIYKWKLFKIMHTYFLFYILKLHQTRNLAFEKKCKQYKINFLCGPTTRIGIIYLSTGKQRFLIYQRICRWSYVDGALSSYFFFSLSSWKNSGCVKMESLMEKNPV